MLRIMRGTDCYWVIGKRRIACVTLSDSETDWPVFDRQTKLVQAADEEAVTDSHLLPVTLDVPAGSDFKTADVLAHCELLMREHGSDGLALTLHCDQPDCRLDECLELIEGANKLGPARTAVITVASALTQATVTALEQAGVEYAQIPLDGGIVYGGHALERDAANLRYAASLGSLLWHVRIRLTNETAGTAGILLNVLSEQLVPSSLDVSFAFADKPTGNDVCLSRDHAEAISDVYLDALTTGFNVRLPSCHRCPTCDSRGGETAVTVNADGTPGPDQSTLCACARLDHGSPDHGRLTNAVHSAILASLYEASGLEQQPEQE